MLMMTPPPPPLPEGKVEMPLFSREELKALMLECGLEEPIFSGEELQAMLLEFEEAQAAFFSPDGLEATTRARDETQAPLPPAVAPCSDSGQERSKKRKTTKPPPPPSKKNARSHAPPSKRKRRLPSRRSLNKMVARCVLERQIDSPDPSRRRTALWCQCEELPLDSPPCALHQTAPGRSWMKSQGSIPAMGGAGEVLVPKLSEHSRTTVTKYARWRSRVWMPSRFFLEHARRKSL